MKIEGGKIKKRKICATKDGLIYQKEYFKEISLPESLEKAIEIVYLNHNGGFSYSFYSIENFEVFREKMNSFKGAEKQRYRRKLLLEALEKIGRDCIDIIAFKMATWSYEKFQVGKRTGGDHYGEQPDELYPRYYIELIFRDFYARNAPCYPESYFRQRNDLLEEFEKGDFQPYILSF